MGRFSIAPRLRGQYSPPRVNEGDELQCEIRGLVVVRGWSDAPITWPMTWEARKRRTLIVAGDLIEAMRVERVDAICAAWHVGRSTVQRWKQALHIGTTEGSRIVRQAICEAMAHDEFANTQRRGSRTPDLLAKLRAVPRGYTAEQRREISERMSAYLLTLPICPVCRLRRSRAHCDAHQEAKC